MKKIIIEAIWLECDLSSDQNDLKTINHFNIGVMGIKSKTVISKSQEKIISRSFYSGMSSEMTNEIRRDFEIRVVPDIR